MQVAPQTSSDAFVELTGQSDAMKAIMHGIQHKQKQSNARDDTRFFPVCALLRVFPSFASCHNADWIAFKHSNTNVYRV